MTPHKHTNAPAWVNLPATTVGRLREALALYPPDTPVACPPLANDAVATRDVVLFLQPSGVVLLSGDFPW